MSQQNNSIDKSRRNSIRGALGGVAVVSVWHKPMVNSVVSPAHAQMSPEVVMNFRAGSTVVTTGPLGRTDTLLDKLIPQALAGTAFPSDNGQSSGDEIVVQAEAIFVEEDTYDVTIVAGAEFFVGEREDGRADEGTLDDSPSEEQILVVTDDEPRMVELVYVYKWQGRLSLGEVAMVDSTAGCGEDTTAEIVDITDSTLSIDLDFRGGIMFDLEPGDITLPEVPEECPLVKKPT